MAVARLPGCFYRCVWGSSGGVRAAQCWPGPSLDEAVQWMRDSSGCDIGIRRVVGFMLASLALQSSAVLGETKFALC